MTIAYRCHHLDGGLVFNLTWLTPCCQGPRCTGATLPYAGGPFPIVAWRQMIAKVGADNQTESGPCMSCPNLRQQSDSQYGGRFRYVTFDHFSFCNSRCCYCESWRRMQENVPHYHLFDTIKEMDADGLFDPAALFTWGGGEPTILDEFEALMGYLAAAKYRQYVNTNAIVYSPALAAAVTSGHANMQVSLDSGTEDTYYNMKGRGLFVLVTDNLRQYASVAHAATHIELKYIIANKNCADADLNGFVELCKELHLYRVSVSPEAVESHKKAILPSTIQQTNKLIAMCRGAGLDVVVRHDLYGSKYSPQLI